ncbi:MAG: glycosyltransferase family 4 protein [Myxococcota bacterium]|nr:glycosyltransferase family 4 protein [Myxococcota bacterium]
MKILHLVSYSIWSGPMPSVYGLASAQRALGHEVSLWYDTKRGSMGGVEEPAQPIVEPQFSEQPLTLSAKSTPREWIRDCGVLSRYLRQERPDLIHVHLSHDHVLAKTVLRFSDQRPPLIRTVHARRSLAKRFGQKFLYRDLGGLIFRSQEDAELYKKDFSANDTHRVIPSGIDLSRFSPISQERKTSLRERWGLPADALVICHAGLIAGRGQLELLRAVAALESFEPWILYIGAGEQETELDDAIAASTVSSRVVRAGYLQGESLVDAYRCADLAFTGKLGNDAGGRIALEPMACGLPILGNTAGALKDIHLPEHGWACLPFDCETIHANLVDALGRGGSQLRAMGESAHRWVQQHRGFESEARATLELYKEACQKSA